MPTMRLKSIASRSIVLHVLPRCFSFTDFGPVNGLKEGIYRLPIVESLRQELWHTTMHAMEEIIVWWHRHSTLFKDHMASRCSHLLLFVNCIRWHGSWIEIDNGSSADVIIKHNEDWPQLQFQLACAYARMRLIVAFDPIRIRVFHRRLSGHPLYDFWLTYIGKGDELFDQRGIVPKQPVAAVFTWATVNGFLELVQFLWQKLPPTQSEYLTVMLWNRLCRRAENGPVFSFLCTELCTINDQNAARITRQCFANATTRLLDVDSKDQAERRVVFLLQHGCPLLRSTLFCSDNFRVMAVAVESRNGRLLSVFKQCLEPNQLNQALETVRDKLTDHQWQRIRCAI